MHYTSPAVWADPVQFEKNTVRQPLVPAGELHAVMANWASGLPEPGIVVMPTGTGKTGTMLAVLVAASIERLLVLVPSAALRDQTAGKFETQGILQREQIVTPDALRPCVGRLPWQVRIAADAQERAHQNVALATFPPAPSSGDGTPRKRTPSSQLTAGEGI